MVRNTHKPELFHVKHKLSGKMYNVCGGKRTRAESATVWETMAGSVSRGGGGARWAEGADTGADPTTLLPGAPLCPAGWLTAASYTNRAQDGILSLNQLNLEHAQTIREQQLHDPNQSSYNAGETPAQ